LNLDHVYRNITFFVYRNPNHNKVQGTRGKMRSSTVSTRFLGAFRFMADLDAPSAGEASAEPGPWSRSPRYAPHGSAGAKGRRQKIEKPIKIAETYGGFQ
jgi:hypothetical protein